MPRLALPILCLSILPAWAQCSDAGVCALERGAPVTQNRISWVGQMGRSGAPDDLTFQTLRWEGQFRWGARTSLTAVLPYGRVSGPLGSTSGLGDAILVVDRILTEGPWGRFTTQLGARFATGRDNAGGLPQRYQMGLGGTDPLLGFRWDGDAWEAGLGYQWAGSRSSNTREPLRRADDLLVHAGLQGPVGLFTSSLKVLAIRRLGASDLRRSDGTLQSLPESDRLQVNLAGGLGLPLSGRWSMEGRIALPLLKRPDNTDGLKRALTVELGATYRY